MRGIPKDDPNEPINPNESMHPSHDIGTDGKYDIIVVAFSTWLLTRQVARIIRPVGLFVEHEAEIESHTIEM